MLFTHSHADHVMGLDEVRRFNVLMRGRDPGLCRCRDGGRAAPRCSPTSSRAPTAKGGGVPQLALTGDRRPVRRRPACRSCPVPMLHGDSRSSAFASAASPISPTAARSRRRRSRCSHGLDVARARRPAPSPAPDALHRRRGHGGGAADRRPQTYFTHICHDLPHAETSAQPADRHGAGLRRAGARGRRDAAGAGPRRSRVMDVVYFPGRPAPAALDEPGAGAGQLRRPAPRPPEDHRAHPPRRRRARRAPPSC